MNFSRLDVEINAVIRKTPGNLLVMPCMEIKVWAINLPGGFLLECAWAPEDWIGKSSEGKTGAGRIRFLVPSSATQ